MRSSGILCQALAAVSGLVAMTTASHFDSDYNDYGLARRGFFDDDDFEGYVDRRDVLDDGLEVYLDRRTLDIVQEHFHLIPRNKIPPSQPFNNKMSNVERVASRRTGLGTGEGGTGIADLHANIIAGKANKKWVDAKVEAQQKGFIQQQNHRGGMNSNTDSLLAINSGNTWV